VRCPVPQLKLSFGFLDIPHQFGAIHPFFVVSDGHKHKHTLSGGSRQGGKRGKNGEKNR
jgi:hypothetical protein